MSAADPRRGPPGSLDRYGTVPIGSGSACVLRARAGHGRPRAGILGRRGRACGAREC